MFNQRKHEIRKAALFSPDTAMTEMLSSIKKCMMYMITKRETPQW